MVTSSTAERRLRYTCSLLNPFLYAVADPLCDFFRYVEEVKQDIHAFSEAVQVYEAKMQEP
jgi:hypothetical protein